MKTLLTFLLLLLTLNSFSQTTAEKEVMKPIDDLFRGMKNGDSALVRSAFTKQVGFVTIGTTKDGAASMRYDRFNDFLKAVGTPHAEQWNELTWDAEIRIDGNFAQVYEKFAFYLGKKYSHCGIDAFHLYHSPEGWKIFNLSDTHSASCEIPERIQALGMK